MQREMTLHFSHETGKATIVGALLQLEMREVYMCKVPQQLTEEQQKNCIGAALNSLTQYVDDGNDLLERIITGEESWIIFTSQKENQRVWFEKKQRKC